MAMKASRGDLMGGTEPVPIGLHSHLMELVYLSSSVVMKLGEIGDQSPFKRQTLVELIWQQQLSHAMTLAHLLETATKLLVNTSEVEASRSGAP